MRLLPGTTRGGSLLLSALLAGCSNAAQAPLSLPLGRSVTTSSFGNRLDIDPYILKGGLTPLKLLELQAEGKLPSWVSHSVLQRMIEARESPRPHFDVRQDTSWVALWTSNGSHNYLIGLSKQYKTVAVIDTASNGCNLPFTVKVDHSRNVWTACELNASSLNQSVGGAMQEYSRTGLLKNSYNATPPCNPSAGCRSAFAYIYDGGSTVKNVFGALSLAGVYTCNSGGCQWQYFTGFIYWSEGDPSGKIKNIPLPYPRAQSVGFMDFDESGNIWFDYYGCESRGLCGYALGEITNPTGPSVGFKTIFGPGSFDSCPAGIYISKQDRAETLNVTDRCNREIFQYRMPVTASSTPFNALGPTPTDHGGYGQPISGGFNRTQRSIALADGNGWLDIGNVSSNTWKTAANVDTIPSLSGAAYTPSDR